MTAAVPAAPQPPPAPPTPGQAAYEAAMAARYHLPPGYGPADGCRWDEIGHERRAAWDAAAQAAIDCYNDTRAWPDESDLSAIAAKAALTAPELAAAMAETRAVRDGYASLCREFADSPQSGQSARISLTVLNRHRKAAGLASLRPAPSGEREDVTMRYRRERDEACAQLAAARNALILARTAAREMADEFTTWTVTPEDQERITGWRQQAGLDGDGG